MGQCSAVSAEACAAAVKAMPTTALSEVKGTCGPKDDHNIILKWKDFLTLVGQLDCKTDR